MKPQGGLESNRRKHAWPRMLSGLAILLLAGVAWAIPGLNDACERVRHPATAIVEPPTLEPPKPPKVEPPKVESPDVEPPKPEPPKVAQAQPRESTAVVKAAQRPTRAQEHASQAKGHGSAAALDDIASLGLLDKTTVQRHIRLSEAKMKYCYERSMAKHTRTGTVRVQFVIKPEGTVTSLTSTAIGVDGEVSSCVAAIIKAIQFPRSGAPVQVVYPFHFVLSDD